jgi:putative ABC transport system substrate-binding protein
MRRRKFLAALGLTPALYAAWPIAAFSQRVGQPPLLGFLDGKSRAAGQGLTTAFQQGLTELGYSEGRNLEIAYRFADGRDEQLPKYAEELVRLKPTLIVAPGVNAAVAAKNVTQDIPIVSWALADAINLGLVASYARPGRNVTGIMPYVEGLPAKQIELARRVLPRARKIGLFGNSNDPKAPPQRKEMEAAARALKLEIVVPDIRAPEELAPAMRALGKERVDVVIVLETALTLSERQQIAALAMANKLPTVFGYRENVEAGGLVSYGVDLRWCSRRTATFVHKILQGARPGDLPVEFPTSLLLAVNLKTAKSLNLTIPQAVLAAADEVMR